MYAFWRHRYGTRQPGELRASHQAEFHPPPPGHLVTLHLLAPSDALKPPIPASLSCPAPTAPAKLYLVPPPPSAVDGGTGEPAASPHGIDDVGVRAVQQAAEWLYCEEGVPLDKLVLCDYLGGVFVFTTAALNKRIPSGSSSVAQETTAEQPVSEPATLTVPAPNTQIHLLMRMAHRIVIQVEDVSYGTLWDAKANINFLNMIRRYLASPPPAWFWIDPAGPGAFIPFSTKECNLFITAKNLCEEGNKKSDVNSLVRLPPGSGDVWVSYVDVIRLRQKYRKTGIEKRVKLLGDLSFCRPSVPSCHYGYAADTRMFFVKSDPTPKDRLTTLPNELLLFILTHLLRHCRCECHGDIIFADEAVHSLCTMSLVSRRFQTPIPDYNNCTLPEEAAKLLCQYFCDPPIRKLSLPSWREQLLIADPKVNKRYNVDRKLSLHRIGYGLGPSRGYDRGPYLNSDEERDRAKAEIIRRWGEPDASLITQVEEPGQPSCFLGDGIVQMADGSTKKVADITVGDEITTETGSSRRITRISYDPVMAETKVIFLNGLGLTTGHPVFASGEWTHPFEIKPVETHYVEGWYNFELEGGPNVTDHSVIINGLVLATLGKDCGDRMTSGWPKHDILFGRGYWNQPYSNWFRSRLCRGLNTYN
ncbi:hypothetical protein Pelo_8755 [Pelomyxa schiedti]|nr:hypothetical protein Pelo_8755 [Pelomyxa schiedti]